MILKDVPATPCCSKEIDFLCHFYCFSDLKVEIPVRISLFWIFEQLQHAVECNPEALFLFFGI